jgi:hypothetical protein
MKVGPYLYQLVYNDALVDAHAVEIEKSINGYSDEIGLKIVLRTKGFSEDAVRNVLVHEILHSVLALSGMWYRMPDGKESEEAMIQASSHMLLAVMRENPAVMKYLTTEE